MARQAVWLIEIDAVDGSNVAQTLRYSSGRGMTTSASDTPPHTHFYGQVSGDMGSGGLIKRTLAGQNATYGTGSVGFGALSLLNLDGSLDYLLDYAIDGREVRIRYGTEGDPFPSGFGLALKARAEQMTHGNRVEITLLDRLADLDKPLCSALLGGTNSPPNGIDGSADQKDMPIPRLYGIAQNWQPISVNADLNIWLVCGNLASVSAAYDRGAALTADSPYSSQADMESTAPASARYRVWATSTGTYIRFGSGLVGTPTLDAATAETRAASLIRQVLLDAGIASGEISSADVAAVNAANAAPVGWMASGTESVREVCNRLAESIGAHLVPDASNIFRMGILTEPSGTPALSLDIEIESARIVASGDSTRGLPVCKVALKYGKNWTVQTDLDQTITGASRAQWLASETRSAVASDSAISTRHRLAGTLEMNTVLLNRSDADAEAARRLLLYGTQRRTYEIIASLSPAQLAAAQLAETIRVTYRQYKTIRFLLNNKLLRILAVDLDHRAGRAVLTAWG